MKKTLLSVFLLITLSSSAQIFWTETFSNACTDGCLAATYSGSNGAWAVTTTGTNGTRSNKWFVSGAECGNSAGQCGTNCGAADPSLHIGADDLILFDPGAAYDAGGLFNTTANYLAESPVVNCTGQSSISVSFNYIMEGDPGSDFAGLGYYDGATWTYYNGSGWTASFTSLPATNNSSCSPQGLWTAYTAALPASANNNANVKIGFRWTNNNDGIGSDPSVAMDDVTLSGTASAVCSVSISVSQPILCNGDCNGALIANATGSAPFTYYWNALPPLPFPTLSNLCAGTYTVSVTDGAACVSTASFTITEPPVLTVLGSYSNPACFGDCTGSISMSPSGGTPGYTYLWSDGSTTASVSNLCAGTYSVIVTDANGCSDTVFATITQPPPIVFGPLVITNTTCIGCTDGTICLGPVSGGTPSYTFALSPNLGTFNGNCWSNLPAGIYIICLTDANACLVCQTDTVTNPPSGVGENFTLDDIVIYPNPFSNAAAFEIAGARAGIYNLHMRDMYGRLVRKYLITNGRTQIAKENLTQGVYFLELRSGSDKMAWRGKVVVE